MRIALIYGTSAPAGRLATALALFAESTRKHRDVEVPIVDLAKTSPPGASGAPVEDLPAEIQGAITTIALADAAIVFSPVYRASAPGSLKNLFDLLPVEALESKPVGVVAMGASAHHFLAVDIDLHPILSWFGAVMIPGIYLTSKSFDAGQPTTETTKALSAYAASVVDIANRLQGLRITPRPLAAGKAS